MVFGIAGMQVLTSINLSDPNNLLDTSNKESFVERKMVMTKYQLIFIDIFSNQGQIFCCLGLINILSKGGEVALYANISDHVNFMDFSLAVDSIRNLFILGGLKADGFFVKSV